MHHEPDGSPWGPMGDPIASQMGPPGAPWGTHGTPRGPGCEPNGAHGDHDTPGGTQRDPIGTPPRPPHFEKKMSMFCTGSVAPVLFRFALSGRMLLNVLGPSRPSLFRRCRGSVVALPLPVSAVLGAGSSWPCLLQSLVLGLRGPASSSLWCWVLGLRCLSCFISLSSPLLHHFLSSSLSSSLSLWAGESPTPVSAPPF